MTEDLDAFELTSPTPEDLAKKDRRRSDFVMPAIYPLPLQPSMTKRAIARRRQEARRLLAMHTLHGAGPEGAACRRCVFLSRHRQAGTWLKCDRAGSRQRPAGDWRARWPACGAYNPRPSKS